MRVLVTFMIDNLEEDTNVQEFVQNVVTDIGDHIIPYHAVELVEVEVA